jgi:hypothetical protein
MQPPRRGGKALAQGASPGNMERASSPSPVGATHIDFAGGNTDSADAGDGHLRVSGSV